MIRRILVWDAPTRAFHWLQALSFGAAYLTADSERYRGIHVAFGYIMLGLLVFRLLWGFVGTHYARFSSFLFKQAVVALHLLGVLVSSVMHCENLVRAMITGVKPAKSDAAGIQRAHNGLGVAMLVIVAMFVYLRS